MRVVGGFGEYILHNSFGEFTSSLVLLQNDVDRHTGFDVCAFLTIHFVQGVAVVGVAVGNVGVGVGDDAGSVLVGVAGTCVFVGVAGMAVFVGTAVGGSRVGVMVGVRVGSGVGVGRSMVRKTRFSAKKSSPFMR